MAELIQCRGCGITFNLEAVPYYDNKCPECVSDEREVVCSFCRTRFDPAEGVRAGHVHITGERESILVCSAQCARDNKPPGGTDQRSHPF